MTIENRLVDLEIKLAYQENALQQLGDVLLRQQRQIDQLEQRCLQLQERIRAIGDTTVEIAATNPADEVPPHY